MEIKPLIREALLTELKDNGFHENIRDDESLIEAGVMDSLGILIMISILQEKFGITVDESDLRKDIFASIDTISQYVERKQAKQY
jgi:acyl carrier protein